MDLREFIKIHMKNKTISNIVQGFQKSQFIDSTNEIVLLVKTILSKLLYDIEHQPNLNQLQSGGIASHLINTVNLQPKKQSFCTEFPIMINNILGLFGFEFSKYLLALFGLSKYINRLIENISNASTYEEIETNMQYIKNIFSLGVNETLQDTNNYEIEERVVKLKDTFDISKYIDNYDKSMNCIDYYTSTTISSNEDLIIDYIMKDIKLHIKSENIISFDDDKQRWCDILNDIYANIEMSTYTVNTVNDLIINLGQFNVCYDKSFIKLFDILYMESYADVPYECWNKCKPYVMFIENELSLDIKCSKYQFIFNQYFHRIYDDTLKTVKDELKINMLNVIITENMYDRLSDITFYLFLNLCRKIAMNQIILTYFGKSTRIQFIQVFQSLIDCCPRMHVFSQSQRAFIHFILLNDKLIEEAVKVVNDEEQLKNLDLKLSSKKTDKKTNDSKGPLKKRGRKSNKELEEMRERALQQKNLQNESNDTK